MTEEFATVDEVARSVVTQLAFAEPPVQRFNVSYITAGLFRVEVFTRGVGDPQTFLYDQENDLLSRV